MKCQENNNKYFMSEALKQASIAKKNGDIPVGCVIVCGDKIISKAYNAKHRTKRVIDHAEILAILKAAKKKKTWILDDCVLYSNLEPCPMCMNVIMQSRIKKIVYSCNRIEKNDKILIQRDEGLMKEESFVLIKDFFNELRNNE